MAVPIGIGLLGVALTVAAALASWFLVEQPANRLKVRFDDRRRERQEMLAPAE